MSTATTESFWQRLGQSQLVAPDRLAALRGRFATTRGASHGNAPLLAEWLVAENAITRYQAEVLLKGSAGPFRFGDFLVRERISRGRLTGHFRAVHEATKHPVLLAFFSSTAVRDSASWSAIQTAAVASYAVRSPRLCGCHELVDLGDYKFAVLESLQGRSVSDVLASGAPLGISQAASITHDVATALTALHGRGQFHGDIRPENIWLCEGGGTLLLYFPFTRDDYTTRTPLNVATANYAAPELDPRQPTPTAASDIYALGCTLYQMLAARPPFVAAPGLPDTLAQKLAQHARDPIVPLDQLGSVPAAVNQVVSYMMAKNVAVRYLDAGAVTDAISPFVDPVQLQTRPGTVPTRAAYERVAQQRRDARTTTTSQPVPQRPTAPPSTPAGAPVSTPAGPTTANVPSGAARTPSAPSGTISLNSASSPSAVTVRPTTTPAALTVPTGTAAAGSAVSNIETSQTAAGVPLQQLLAQDEASSAAALRRAASTHKRDTEKPGMKRSTRHALLAIGGTVGAVAAIMLALMFFGSSDGENPPAIAKDDTGQSEPAEHAEPTAPSDNPVVGPANHEKEADEGPIVRYENVIPDDGKTLWSSPTQADIPNLRYIAPGGQMIVSIRAADLFGTAAPRLLEAAGPGGLAFADWVQSETGLALREIDRLDIAFYSVAEGRPVISLVVHPAEQFLSDQLLARWQNPATATYNGVTYYQLGRRGYYIPGGRTAAFAVGDVKQIHEIIDMLDEPAWLPKPMDALRKEADQRRHLNIFFTPSYVRSARETLYPGRLAPMHEVISWLLGTSEEVQAGLVSCHFGDASFAELRLFAARDKQPEVLAREFYDRLSQAPRRLNGHLLTLSISDYSRGVLSALPDMLRSISQHTRYDRNRPRGRQAVLRCYLPPGALTHLALATDLTLLETAGTTGEAQPVAPTKTLRDRLRQPTNLAFVNDNLLHAIDALSKDIGVKIEIRGEDLQTEGITKNQSFGIDMRDRPAEEILLQILMLANPDKVTEPSDPALKLVYVVKETSQGGEDVIWVTTRGRAADRGDTLPAVFQAKP